MLKYWHSNYVFGAEMPLPPCRKSLSVGAELYALAMVFGHVRVIVGHCVEDHLWHTMHVAATSGVP